MYFADLSPYEYAYGRPSSDVLNVGWLSDEHPFSKGSVPPGIFEKLLELFASSAVNQMRGYHDCPFCPEGTEPRIVLADGSQITLGSAELWFRDEAGTVYAAPNLVYHYMKEHQYMPPEQFQDALVYTWGSRTRWDANKVAAEIEAKLFCK